MLVFLDLETTGLDPQRDEVLEVAAIVTDDKLNVVTRFEALVYPQRPLWTLDEFVRDMHTKSGLLGDLRELSKLYSDEHDPSLTSVSSARAVDARLALVIRESAVQITKYETTSEVKIDRPQLAGNTISFDRAFLKAHLPETHAELHYRNLDVSSLNELARRFFPTVYAARPRLSPKAAHRALADAQNSLDGARHYATALGVVGQAVAA